MRFAGLIVTGIGIFFLLEELDLIPHLGKMWPVIPIIVGLAMLISSFGGGISDDEGRQGRRSSSEDGS
jgi:hypothetical protein